MLAQRHSASAPVQRRLQVSDRKTEQNIERSTATCARPEWNSTATAWPWGSPPCAGDGRHFVAVWSRRRGVLVLFVYEKHAPDGRAFVVVVLRY